MRHALAYGGRHRMNRHTFRLYTLTKVPLAWLAGLRLAHIDDNSCRIAVRLGWLNQNPFRSMFWAAQAMAAEFSTGTLCREKVLKSGQSISMLLVRLEAGFTKKAVGRIVFSCGQGGEIDEVLRRAIDTREGQAVRLRSVGTNEQGEQVAELFFTWSFKVRR
jgi:hypothetical protein